MNATAVRPPGERFDRLDVLRALAIVWMAAFHFCFDLNHFNLWQPRQFFTRDPFWTMQRTCIVTLFVFCAALVSIGSAFMFPRTWIGFGVLHGMAAMLILARLAWPLGRWLWPLGLAAIALPHLGRHPFFDPPWMLWVGLSTRKPLTEDYVPVLPWLGVMFIGLGAGRWLLQNHRALLAGPVPRAARPLAVLGRWSLSFYMLHQPVFIGAILGGRQLGWW